MSTAKNAPKRQVLTWWIVASLSLLAVAFAAPMLSDEFNWSLSDFVIAAIFLIVVGSGISLVAGGVKSIPQRRILIILICLVAIVVWIDLAVGLFGLPWSGN